MRPKSADRQRPKSFDELLLESVDEAFSALGNGVKDVLYSNLETKFLIIRQEIPYKIDAFSNALERVFGSLGARNLEILIMKSLHKRVTCQYSWEGPKWLIPDLTFRQYVELSQLSYDEKRKIGEVEVLINAEEKQELLVRRRR